MSNSRVLNAINQTGIENIYIGAIENAAKNIRVYIKKGIIENGRVTGYWPVHKTGRLKGYFANVRGEKRGPVAAREDLHFFQDGGECDMMLSVVGINVTASAIRRGLGI